MKRLFGKTVVAIFLLFGDTLVSILLAFIFGEYQKTNNSYYGSSNYISAIIFLGYARFIYYLVFFVLILCFFRFHIFLKNRLLGIIFINTGSYIGISILYGFVLKPNTKELFENPLFYLIIVSTIISPMILYRIPYFKKKVYNVLYYQNVIH